MTLKELSQLYYLNNEVKMIRNKISELEVLAGNTSVNITGMPNGGGKSDRTGKIATELCYYKEKLRDRLERCRAEWIHLNGYISDCPDSLTRLILTHRFIDGLSWRQTAAQIGSGTTEESVKKTAYRYIKKH